MDSTSAIDSRFTDPPDGSGENLVDKAAGVPRSIDRRSVAAVDPALLKTLYGPVAEPLLAVEKRLRQELKSNHELLSEVLRHGTQLGGKRLRPALLLLAAQASGEMTDDHIVLATVVEMVHTATLVHDDVIDNADTRRHVATVNAMWNEHTSILLGDYLFAQSFYLAATLPSTEACRWIGQAAKLVCEGELRQVLSREVLDLDENQYIDLIRGKTAELCRVAGRLGAKFAHAEDRVVQAMGDFGDALGIAFQIADDYLDLWGDDQTVGKTLGTDVSQGKLTLPIIRMLRTAASEQRMELIEILSGPTECRLSRIRPHLRASDAQQYTRDVAYRFRDQALKNLDMLSPSAATEALRAMARFSVDRRF